MQNNCLRTVFVGICTPLSLRYHGRPMQCRFTNNAESAFSTTSEFSAFLDRSNRTSLPRPLSRAWKTRAYVTWLCIVMYDLSTMYCSMHWPSICTASIHAIWAMMTCRLCLLRPWTTWELPVHWQRWTWVTSEITYIPQALQSLPPRKFLGAPSRSCGCTFPSQCSRPRFMK